MKRALTRKEFALCAKIANRAETELGYPRVNVLMDIKTCHESAQKLKLEELLNAPLVDFWHDVLGINRHLDRTANKLSGDFLPRYAGE